MPTAAPQEKPRPADDRLARRVYEFMVQQPPGAIVPSLTVQQALGLPEHQVKIGIRWAIRSICPTTGRYIGSKRGPAGGYFVTNDRDEAMDDSTRSLKEFWSVSQKNLAKVKTAKQGKLGKPSELRKIHDSFRATTDLIENMLADRGIIVGHVLAEQQAAAKAAAKAQSNGQARP